MKGIIHTDPEILGGTPVFWSTRVPIKNLFDYLETGKTVNDFLQDFEGIKQHQAMCILEISRKIIDAMYKIEKIKICDNL